MDKWRAVVNTDGDWIYPAKDMDKWRAVVNTAMNFRVLFAGSL
jgi:hypothetical protein